ncbi:MAG: hypothetical protein JXR83_15490 [Deltaproteobacteria bacterium]|nr:hypothetical protein [Deltaproteobacteria bacterium]
MKTGPDPIVVHDLSVKALVIANAALLTALLAYVGVSLARAPERIPVHYRTVGDADRWISADPAQWLPLPACALLTGLILIALALLLPRLRLYRYGMPHHQQFMALPWPRQVPVIRSMVLLTLAIALINTAVLAALELAIFGSGTAAPRVPDSLVVALSLLLYPLVVIPWWVVMRRQLAQALRSEAAGGDGSGSALE